MKMIRLPRILWKLPGLWESVSQGAILTARFTTGTIGLDVEGILGYARITDARTKRTKRHVTTTRHSREKFWSRARHAAAAYGADVWPSRAAPSMAHVRCAQPPLQALEGRDCWLLKEVRCDLPVGQMW